MRSDQPSPHATPVGNDKYRAELARRVEPSLRSGERITAILPFVSSLKRPKAPGAPRGKAGKVRTGVYQSWRRYRPMVLTNRRLIVFDSGRTPNPREVLDEFSVADLEVVSVTPLGHSLTRFVLEFPGIGQVPFEAGRREQQDLEVLVTTFGGPIA